MIVLGVQLPRHFLGKYQWGKVGRKHDFENNTRLLPVQEKGNVDVGTRNKTDTMNMVKDGENNTLVSVIPRLKCQKDCKKINRNCGLVKSDSEWLLIN